MFVASPGPLISRRRLGAVHSAAGDLEARVAEAVQAHRPELRTGGVSYDSGGSAFAMLPSSSTTTVQVRGSS